MAFQIQIAGADELGRQQFVTQVVIERTLYEHTRADIVLRWQEHSRYGERQAAMQAAKILNCPIDVQWKDNNLGESTPVFHGYIENVSARRDASSSSLRLSCVAFSKRTDLVSRYRTFQATTLLDIAQHIAGREPLVKIAQAGDLAKQIVLSVQHAETDFVYLSRMLHAWGVPMATHDQTGQVMLGARGTESPHPFPDIGYGWTEVDFLGALKALPKLAGGGSGPTSLARAQVGALQGQLSRLAADYHPIPVSPDIKGTVSETVSQTDTSGYHLKLEGASLPFSPGEVVPFEGQQHLIRRVRIEGHPQMTTATQEFWLQPLTLPLSSERKPLNWPSRAVWGHVTANEHDPQQQGRIQVEFEWEHMDPQASSDRAWLHTLTPYGGGSGGGKKSSQYSGFYSVPEVGERVLVEFVGDWDSEAVVIGVVRQHPQGVTNNPKHTKRWSTPSGNEVTMHTKDGVDVLRMKNQGKLAFESQVTNGRSSVTLNCGGHPEDIIHFENAGGTTRLDISSRTDIYIQSGNHIDIEGHSVHIKATGPGGVQIQSTVATVATEAHVDVTSRAVTGKIDVTASKNVTVKSETAKVDATGQTGVDVKAVGGDVKVDGGPNVLLNSGSG